jgi:hypothetical protein
MVVLSLFGGVVNLQNVNMITQFVKNRYDQKTKTYE